MTNRTKFIINTSVEYFAANSILGTELDEQTARILEFLENDEHTVISAVHNKSDGKIKFHHRIPNDEVCLLFYKVPQVGTGAFGGGGSAAAGGGGGGVGIPQTSNEPLLGILTLEGGLVKSIYNSVSRVFSPHAEAKKQTEYSPELSGLLENLHVSLGSTLGLPQSGITNVRDEIKYWKQKLGQKQSSRVDREMAQLFISVLEPLSQQIDALDRRDEGNGSESRNGARIEEFFDFAHNNLDELWRLPYNFPQQRMSDLLDVIGNRLLELCLAQLYAEDIWSVESYYVDNLMGQCIDTVDAWIQLCDSLTRLFWPNYIKHPWVGDPYNYKRGQQFKERLAEIRNIKNLFKQIATLLNDNELEQMFQLNSPFSEFNIFDTSGLGLSKWQKALMQFEQLLQPIDERIAAALKGQLHNHLSNPRQIIFIFSKYETLIQRPVVLELLTIEREQFLQSLHLLLQDLRKAMTDTNMEPDTGHLSVICNECRWLKVVQYQIQEIEKVIHLVSGREGYDKIHKAVQEIKEETESLLRTNFEIWSGQCSTSVKSGELKLRDDQAVVRFEREGRQLMRVTFNPKLVTFCQDVREFENLGYSVPIDLRSAATHAAKYMCYARRLQQIATFHNTIGDRMIPCQRPIMLKNAIELSKLVQSETVAWNDEDSVERYVNMLQAAVSKLSSDNTLLVGYHEQAKRTVIKLMNTDLFTQNQMWKDEMRHLRELVATLERQGYTNLDAFKLHWDHQLYKVLEYQYVIGLLDMNNKLPDIHIKIVFRQRQLCFSPPEEEIREKYFTQLRRFIERPCNFRGLSEKSSDLFKSMIELNFHHFGPLFERAEQLFEKLATFKQLWLPWIALGCVDIEELCSIHLNTADDWDRDFRACKNFSQNIAKLQNSEESIDCIVINVLPLRMDIEFISRRYWEALLNSLRTSILTDVSIIQEFLQQSLQFLQNVPMDEGSITESGMKYEKIMTDLPKISETLELVKAKDTCLAGWCKERVSALAGIIIQWEKLHPLLENHAVILQRQVDMIKTQAQAQIQNLRNEADKFLLRWESTIAELESNEDATLELFKERQAHWQQIKTRKEHLLTECGKFNMEFPAEILRPFDEIEAQMLTQSKQWEAYDNFLQELEPILKEEWAIYRRRPYVLSEFISKWEGSVHASIDLPSKRIRQHVERLQSVMPVLQQLQVDGLNERHWARIFMLLHKPEPNKPLHSIYVSDVLEDLSSLQAAANEISNIVRQAASEQIVRQALTELDQWSVTAQLKLISRKDAAGNDVTLIKDYQEVLNKIGDNQSLLQSAKNSAAFESFSDQAELWESRLNTLDALLSSLSQSQRRWVYLEPVFGAGTLRNEEALFKRVDKDFRYVMREIQADSRVISLVKINNITTIVNTLEAQLARCQHNLVSYITEKRNSFPRFYFLGDDDLLELLGQASKDAEVIQKHIKKLFPGCHSLAIVQGASGHYVINAINSAEGDTLTLKQPVEISGAIELWLNSLVTMIQQTLKEQIYACYTNNNANGGDNLNEHILRQYSIQVLATVRALHFTKQTEKAIVAMSLPKLQQALSKEISQYALLKNRMGDDEAAPLLRLKLSALLYDLVHYAAVVSELVQQNVMHVSDWHWLSQLRFYLGDSNSNNNSNTSRTGASTSAGAGAGAAGAIDAQQVYVRMVYAEFEYSYEFLGNPNKLVHTSLTHKCYLILTQAMHMGLGGNPFGPAGTGKTECVKALGAMLGRLVLVFNCDENVDIESMGLILTGLARCGAWGCFDEFNRLQEATLSAISMLIQPIQCALKEKTDVVQLGERNIKLNQHCGIFVTLNPAGAEYGGRQKLPGNIQALFRPIVMQQPEPREIARVMLFVEGYQSAAEIAERIVELFDLCGKMLSAQRHYDWGLRELKTVLLGCGEGLRQQLVGVTNEQLNSSASPTDANAEMSIVLQCLRASTMSKLAQHDVSRFEMLLRNVFPEITFVSKQTTALEQALNDAFQPLGLTANDRQVTKARQLHEQLLKRMGVVVVGPPGCGKSTIITLLRQALTMGTRTDAKQIRVHTISPKAMKRVQLLGRLDPDTRQWIDGVLTNTAVVVNQEAAHVHSWIVCDGSIDPEWIEALNSVLDDNKLLTLPSGWRIQFGDNINFIFETDDVSNASPATISRMGILNINREDYPLKSICAHQLAHAEYGDLLQSYIEQHFTPAAAWIEREYLNALHIYSHADLLHAVLLHIQNAQHLEQFCIGMLHALLGFLPTERHNEFANMVLQRANLYVPNPNQAALCYYNVGRGSIEQYVVDDGAPHLDSDSGVQLIETAAVKSYLYILDVLLKAPANTPFLLLGPSGAAKSLLLAHAVLANSGYDLVTINCSTQLTSAYVLHILKQHCVTVSGLRGREYKPKHLRLVVFLKNLDLCYLDDWGACEIVELLLQLVQRNGFYADNLEWISISGLQICGSITCNASAMGNANLLKIAPRYLAINQYVRMSHPTEADMLSIVQSHLEPLLYGSNPHFKATSASKGSVSIQHATECLMALFQRIHTTFTPTGQALAHYQFSPKFIMKLLDALKYYPSQNFSEALYCEILSVFKDRLANEQDVEQFENIMKQTMRKYCGKEKVYFVPKSAKANSELRALQHDEWMEEVQKQITICNAESYCIEAPITEELLLYTAKVARVLARAETHLLVLGQPGGRHLDAVHAAAMLQQAKVQSIQGDAGYGLQDFYNELKLVMQMAALEDQCVCLLIEHCWLSYVPDILKPLEALLEGSDILDLFGDDLESIASGLKQAAQLEGFQESLSVYFMKRVRQNLHLVIILDCTNVKTNDYFNKYPALYRNMELLYVRAACSETYSMLPKKYIEMMSERLPVGSGKVKVPVCSYFADAVEELVSTQAPKRFYQLIESYFYIYANAAQDIDKRVTKLKQGVDKLAAAHALVDELKSNAVKQEEALAEKRKLANDALEMISSTMRNANEQKSSMLELKQKTEISSEQLKIRQREIQKELAEVEPILAEASTAVGQIKSEALSEIRSLRAPPEAVRDILEGVLRLMGIRDTSWNSMKTFLAKRGVKEDIRSLDPARINPENCEAVEKLLRVKADSFEMKNAKRASAAAAPLAAWVKASVRYSKVIQSIKPLEREQNELQRNLDVAEGEMQSLATGLDDVDKRVKQLSAKLNSYTQEAAVLELKLEEARSTLSAAEVLVEKLSSEFTTWSMQLDEYKSGYRTLDTKSLMIGLSLNYFGHLNLEQRVSATASLSSALQLSQAFDIRKSLLTEQEQIIWESMGLARDAQIIENAALLREMISLPYGSYPIPLIVDPTQTAINWLEEYLRSLGKPCEFTTQNNGRLAYTIELAVRFGKVLVVQDCQELRPPLMQMVASHVYVKFNKRQLVVGNKLVDVHEQFKLLLFSKTDKLSIASELSGYLVQLPFTVTSGGLCDQLMSKAIVLKNAALEQKRIQLLKQEGELLKQRIDLQDKLLEELSNAQGDILKNQQLLQTLNEVKESSSHIDKSLKESALVKETLLAEFSQLRVLCARAAEFYTGITLSYELSALVYIELFLSALQASEMGGAATGQHNELRVYESLVRSTFQYLARSTLRSSHLSLALYICRHAYPERITKAEWELFVSNFMSSADGSMVAATKLPDCMSREQLLKLQTLLAQVPELETQLQLDKDYIWRGFFEQQTDDVLPAIKSAFHRVLIVQIFRPDLIVTQLRRTVSELLAIAPDSISHPTVEQLVDESTPDKPLLIITQAENDPATEIKCVALKKYGKDKYQELSIGKGIEQRALSSIRQAAEQGKWICVKNVHLVPMWLTELERELGFMKKSPEFRLWLICESTQGFSEAVIYKFVKVLYENPSGLKAKVRRMTQNFAAMETRTGGVGGGPNRDAKQLKMRLVMFMTMAVLQERRKYIPQGWSKYYEFGESDLKAALDILNWLDGMVSSGRCDWQLMQRLCENVAFGGRISNVRDLQVLQTYLGQFCHNDVLSNRWTPLNLRVAIPTSAQLQDYYTAIAKLPDVDEPATFCLSNQANMSRDIEYSKAVIKELRASYYVRGLHDDGGHKLEKQIKPILSLWRKLAANCTIMQTVEELTEPTTLDQNAELTKPWFLFVMAELKLGAQLFEQVHRTLAQLHGWLKESLAQGLTLSHVDAQLLQTLAENQVPNSWRKLWSGPQTVVDYLKALIVRVQAAELRYRQEPHVVFAEEICFVNMFNCQNFLACLKLQQAHDSGVSCMRLLLVTQISGGGQHHAPGDVSTRANVVKVAPLRIDGADEKSPAFQIFYKIKSNADELPAKSGKLTPKYDKNGEEQLSLPLYANASREQLICHLELPIKATPEHLLLSGAALIIDDY